VPAAGLVSQVHTGIEEALQREQLLDVEEVSMLEGLIQDFLLEI
jgi:hypothetical protein